MWLHVVVLSLLCGRFVAFNENPETWLKDHCDDGLECIKLKANSFDDYVFEVQSVPKEDDYKLYYFRSQKGKANEEMVSGGDWSYTHKGRVVARLPIYMSKNKFFVQLYSDRVEVITFLEGNYTPITTDSTGRRCFLIMSNFVDNQHISPDDVKHSFIFANYLFINSTTAIDLLMYMRFKEVHKLSTQDKDSSDRCRLEEKYWSYGMVPIDTIEHDIVHRAANRLTSQCFGNPNAYCSFDTHFARLVITPYPVALRFGGLVMEQLWTQVVKDQVPIYRFRHIDMPPNVVFYFPDINHMYGSLTRNGKPTSSKNFYVRGFMPQPKEYDRIYELMMKRTTTTPRTTTTTTTLTPIELSSASLPPTPPETTTMKTTPTTTPKTIVVPTALPRPEQDIHNSTDHAEEHGHHEEENSTSSSWGYVPQMAVIVGMIYFIIIGYLWSNK